MKPFSLFGKKIPVWIPAGIIALGLIGAVVYATSKTDDWREDWLKKQPDDVRLFMEDKSLLCSNEYYSTEYSDFKSGTSSQITLEIILEEKTETLSEFKVWEEKLANYLNLDTKDWNEKQLKDRPEAIKSYEEEIENLNKRLKQLEEKLKQLEEGDYIDSTVLGGSGSSSGSNVVVRGIDTRRFINNALGNEDSSRDKLITFDKESWLKFQIAVQWEFISNTDKEKYFTKYGNFRPAYQYHTGNLIYPWIGGFLSSSPYFDSELAEEVSESKYDSMYIEKDDMYYIEVPGDYKNSNYKAVDTLKGMQCIEYLREISPLYEDDISFIKELPDLKYLNIINPNHAKYLRYAGKLQVLIAPVIRDLDFLNRGFDGMLNPQFTNLKYLSLDLTAITDLEYIKTRQNLEYLMINIEKSSDICGASEVSDEEQEMHKKNITEMLAGLYWPKIKYLKIEGFMDTNFVWLTKFDTLEFLDLDVKNSCRENLYPDYKVCGDRNYYNNNDPYAYIKFNIQYSASDLLFFQDSSLKELYIKAEEGLKLSDCDMLKNTLKDTKTTCFPNLLEACPAPEFIEGNVLATSIQKVITGFDSKGWAAKRREIMQEGEKNNVDTSSEKYQYALNEMKDDYMEGYDLQIRIGENGVIEGVYVKWWGSTFEHYADYCSNPVGWAVLWLNKKPAIGGCATDNAYKDAFNRLEKYILDSPDIMEGFYCFRRTNLEGGLCKDNYTFEEGMLRDGSGTQVKYNKLNIADTEIIYIPGGFVPDTDKTVVWPKVHKILLDFFQLTQNSHNNFTIVDALIRAMEPCCSGGKDVCTGPNKEGNFKNGCAIVKPFDFFGFR